MLLQLGKKYRGHWESEFNPVSVRFNENIWKVVSVSDDIGEYFFSLFQKSEGSAFFITSEDLEGEVIDSEIIEEVIFAKVFNADNDVSVDHRFTDEIGSDSFSFIRYRFTNKKFGPQLANYGYNVFGNILVIIGLTWPAVLEVSKDSYWPIKHEALISGIDLDY